MSDLGSDEGDVEGGELTGLDSLHLVQATGVLAEGMVLIRSCLLV
jgi:hypothetical protein